MKAKPLQFRVSLGKYLDMESEYKHVKNVSSGQRMKGDIGQEQLQVLRQQALNNHEQLHVAGAQVVDFGSIAQQMAGGTNSQPGQAFYADNLHVGKDGLDDFINSESEPEEQEGEAEQDGEDQAAEKDKEKPAPFFDRDSAVTGAKRACTLTMQNFENGISKARRECEETLAAASELKPEMQAHFIDETKLARSRLNGLVAVLEGPDALAEYKASFDKLMAMGAASDAVEVGLSPPTRSYTQLVALSELQAHLSKFARVRSKDDLDLLSRTIADQKKPIIALVNALGSARLQLAKAMAQRQKAMVDAAKVMKVPKAPPDGDVFETAGAVALQIDRLATQDALRDFLRSPADPSNLHKPMLVTAAALQNHIADLHAALVMAMKEGRKTFHAEVCRTKASMRGVMDFVGAGKEDMVASARNFFAATVPIPQNVVNVTEASPVEVSPDLAGILTPAMYGISPGEIFCACERYHLGAIRWQEHGTRQAIYIILQYRTGRHSTLHY